MFIFAAPEKPLLANPSEAQDPAPGPLGPAAEFPLVYSSQHPGKNVAKSSE